MSESATERPMRVVEEPQADSSLSVLGQLKSRREDIVKRQFIDLPVPRWDNPNIVVRYKPLEHALFRSAANQVERADAKRRSETEVNVNVDILARSCIGVFAVVNGSRYSLREGDPTGEWTTFDADLADNLGCEHTARAVVKALYIVEGDILSTANKIAEFSGYKEQEADEELMGE